MDSNDITITGQIFEQISKDLLEIVLKSALNVDVDFKSVQNIFNPIKLYSTDACQIWEFDQSKVIKIKNIWNKSKNNNTEIDNLLINVIKYGTISIKCDDHISCQYSYIIMNKLCDDYDLTPQICSSLIIDCVNSLKEIHKLGFVHNDIKISNILYDPVNVKYVFIDFEHATMANNVILSPIYNKHKVVYLLTLGYDINDYMNSYPQDLMALFHTVCQIHVPFNSLFKFINDNYTICKNEQTFYKNITEYRQQLIQRITDPKLLSFYDLIVKYKTDYNKNMSYIEHYYDDIIAIFQTI